MRLPSLFGPSGWTRGTCRSAGRAWDGAGGRQGLPVPARAPLPFLLLVEATPTAAGAGGCWQPGSETCPPKPLNPLRSPGLYWGYWEQFPWAPGEAVMPGLVSHTTPSLPARPVPSLW